MSIDENPSSPQSAINVTTKKKMNPQAKAFCFIKIRFVPYRLLLRWVTDKKKAWSRSFIWQEALVAQVQINNTPHRIVYIWIMIYNYAR